MPPRPAPRIDPFYHFACICMAAFLASLATEGFFAFRTSSSFIPCPPQAPIVASRNKVSVLPSRVYQGNPTRAHRSNCFSLYDAQVARAEHIVQDEPLGTLCAGQASPHCKASTAGDAKAVINLSSVQLALKPISPHTCDFTDVELTTANASSSAWCLPADSTLVFRVDLSLSPLSESSVKHRAVLLLRPFRRCRCLPSLQNIAHILGTPVHESLTTSSIRVPPSGTVSELSEVLSIFRTCFPEALIAFGITRLSKQPPASVRRQALRLWGCEEEDICQVR